VTRFALVFVVAACGGAAPATTRPRVRPPAEPPPTSTFVFRQRHVRTGGATRTTFELSVAGDRATLVETDEQADGSAWTTRGSHTFRGTHHGGDLELASDDQQPLALHCESRTVQLAGPQREDCTVQPGTRVLSGAQALVCTAPGQSVADADADDQFVFAPAPGFEWLDAACGGGLRQASP
jgi:hypothetical protein